VITLARCMMKRVQPSGSQNRKRKLALENDARHAGVVLQNWLRGPGREDDPQQSGGDGERYNTCASAGVNPEREHNSRIENVAIECEGNLDNTGSEANSENVRAGLPSPPNSRNVNASVVSEPASTSATPKAVTARSTTSSPVLAEVSTVSAAVAELGSGAVIASETPPTAASSLTSGFQPQLPSSSQPHVEATKMPCTQVTQEIHAQVEVSESSSFVATEQALSSDPRTWNGLSRGDKDSIARRGPGCVDAGKIPKDSRGRSFAASALKKRLPNGEQVARDWLLWSEERSAFFCFPCCLTAVDNADCRSALTNVDVGLSGNWRKAHERFSGHEANRLHVDAYLKWREWQCSLLRATGVDSALQKAILLEKDRWREVLKCVVQVVVLLSERNQPFRGESDKVGDKNNGLFLGILEALGVHNSTLRDHLEMVKRHQEKGERMQAHYLSNRIQNEIIQACARKVRECIADEIQKSYYYSILVDSTPDSSHKEQHTFVLRFALKMRDEWDVVERFLCMEPCSAKTAQAITSLILRVLEEQRIDILRCRGQCYDNAAVMAGVHRGVQKKINDIVPEAFFSNCAAHSLNLSGVHAAETSVQTKRFFGNVQKIFVFFSGSPMRWEILKNNLKVSLHSVSTTRWSARIEAVRPLYEESSKVVEALNDCEEKLNLSAEIFAEIDSLRNWLSSFEFFAHVSYWYPILRELEMRSKILQSSTITLDEEVKILDSLLVFLESAKGNWDAYLSWAKTCAEKAGVTPHFKNVRKSQPKVPFEDQLSVAEKVRAREDNKTVAHDQESAADIFKTNVFFAVLDGVIENVKSRHDAAREGNELFSFLWSCESVDSRTEQHIENLCEKYRKDLTSEALRGELEYLVRVRPSVQTLNTTNPLALLNAIFAKRLETVFPQLCVALRIFVSIPVSVASCERTFSKLALVKDSIRSTMTDERLNDLLLLNIERQILERIDRDAIIDFFAEQKARKQLF
jgi:hypothetical protein